MCVVLVIRQRKEDLILCVVLVVREKKEDLVFGGKRKKDPGFGSKRNEDPVFVGENVRWLFGGERKVEAFLGNGKRNSNIVLLAKQDMGDGKRNGDNVLVAKQDGVRVMGLGAKFTCFQRRFMAASMLLFIASSLQTLKLLDALLPSSCGATAMPILTAIKIKQI